MNRGVKWPSLLRQVSALSPPLTEVIRVAAADSERGMMTVGLLITTGAQPQIATSKGNRPSKNSLSDLKNPS